MGLWETRTLQCYHCNNPMDVYVRKDMKISTTEPDQDGTSTSSELPERFHCDLTVSVTKSVQLSLEATVESDPQDITEARQVWRDVSAALGELQMWLLGPATQTAWRSMQS